jgi:hypothetical protein
MMFCLLVDFGNGTCARQLNSAQLRLVVSAGTLLQLMGAANGK